MRTLPNDRLTADAAPGSTRRCILTGVRDDPARLIRLALDDAGGVHPDVLAKAPGRGAWIAVDAATLDTARANGKLRGALARAFKGAPVSIPDDLSARIAAVLERATLDRLGLEARAGNVVTGNERIDAAARGGAVDLLLHAADAGADGKAKLAQAWRVGNDEQGSGREGITLPVDRAPLSVALGRENAVHLAVTDARAAARVLAILDRWRNFLGHNVTDVPAFRGSATTHNDEFIEGQSDFHE